MASAQGVGARAELKMKPSATSIPPARGVAGRDCSFVLVPEGFQRGEFGIYEDDWTQYRGPVRVDS